MTVDTRVFDDGVLSGVKSWFHYDTADDTFSIETEIDARALVADNRRAMNDVDKGPRPFSGKEPHALGYKVAEVPMTLLYLWEKMEPGILKDGKALRKKLDNPELAAFRRYPGRLA